MEVARILKKMGVQKKRPGGISTYYGIRERTAQEMALMRNVETTDVQPVQPCHTGCTAETSHE